MITSVLASLVLGQSGIAINRTKTIEAYHVLNVCGAPTGSKFLASAEDFSVRVVDAAKGATVMTLFGHPQPVYGLAYNRTGTVIATGDESGRIWIWDAKSGKKLREFDRTKGHIRGIQSLSFNAAGTLIASTGKDDVIIIWNVATGKRAGAILGNGLNVASATFNSSGSILAGTLGGGVRLYASKTWAAANAGAMASGQLNDIALSANGTRMVGGDRGNNLVVYSPAAKTRVKAMPAHDDMVMRVAISGNGRVAASSSTDRKVCVWDLNSFSKIGTLENQSAIGSPMTFTGDGKYLITASVNDTLQIYSVTPSQAAGAATSGKRRRR